MSNSPSTGVRNAGIRESHHLKPQLLLQASQEDRVFRPYGIFLREWAPESVSQDGQLDSEPAKPVCFLEVPPGIRTEVKRNLVKRISGAITEAYHLPDVLIFLREYPLDMVSQDGGSSRRTR